MCRLPTTGLISPVMSIQLLHADADLLVVVKPTLLLSVPGRGPEKQDCLVSRLAAEHGEVLAVHRLDWETSGLLVLARNKRAHREMSILFQQRAVEKQYVAVVYGRVAAQQGEVNLPLIVDWPNRPRQMVDHERGKPSLTRWEVMERGGDRSRLRLTPVTGRTHQLRVHMLSMGHPILGDSLYAEAPALTLAPRLLLHAATLGFRHPLTGELLAFESPPPF
ncbi:MAG: RluA family pseudouridine synthase [Gammaproteobacteria bacterium]|nr:RluA family pseudouridine synthase [Gammaproteobacteria bacterium]